MLDKLKSLLFGKYIGGQVRHLLTGLAGYLIAKGIVPAEDAANAVDALLALLPGITAYVVGSGASVVNKKIES